ncbi:MAG: hypothetical protein AB7H97_05345 [Pseudobdellovibrionaceae bacterium]
MKSQNKSDIPSFIAHYSRGEPFRTITSLPHDLRSSAISNFTETTAWGLNRFSDPEYLVRRLEVEKHIRNQFIEKGGNPDLNHPIYFFLGPHRGFEQHPLNKRYEIHLEDLCKDSITFTYGDTMLSFFDDYRKLSGEKYQNSLCNRIFLLDELDDLFSHADYPENEPLYVEAQLWTVPKIVRGEAIKSI